MEILSLKFPLHEKRNLHVLQNGGGEEIDEITSFCICRYNLGKVLESLGEVEAASDCMAIALEVETTNPILPILSIPVTFEWFRVAVV